MAKHKTATTYGLLITELDITYFHYYSKEIQETESNNENDVFLARSKSAKLSNHYQRYIVEYTTFFNIPVKPPKLTNYRKASSTQAIQNVTMAAMDHISCHMTHSTTTAEKYYRAHEASGQSLAAYENISSITKTLKITLRVALNEGI